MQIPGEPPLNGPAVVDMWLDAAAGDASGMALVSLMMPYLLPNAFDWGHFLAMGRSAPEMHDPDRDYRTELTPDTLIASPLALLIWGVSRGWPATEDQSVGDVQDSDVETLLISGTLDGSTPMQYARDELLPHLSNGHQVIVEGQAHTETFWNSQSPARARLLHAFFDDGAVDDSAYENQRIDFDVKSSWGKFARFTLALLSLIVFVTIASVAVIIRKLLRSHNVD